MYKKCLCFLLACSHAYVFSQQDAIHRTLDFNKMEIEGIPGHNLLDWQSIGHSYHPFEGNIELIPLFDYLSRMFKIHTAVEVNSGVTGTVKCLSLLFDHLFAIESRPVPFHQISDILKDTPKATSFHGALSDFLQTKSPSLKEGRVLFYLSNLLEESESLLQDLDLIASSYLDDCIVVIEKIQAPERIHYLDPTEKNKVISYSDIEGPLSKIYSAHIGYYVVPRSATSHAMYIAIPKKWVYTTYVPR